jgi:hypothetical protein
MQLPRLLKKPRPNLLHNALGMAQFGRIDEVKAGMELMSYCGFLIRTHVD